MQGFWAFVFRGQEKDIQRLSTWVHTDLEQSYAYVAKIWKQIEWTGPSWNSDGVELEKLVVNCQDSCNINGMEDIARFINEAFPELEMAFYTASLSSGNRSYLYSKADETECAAFDAGPPKTTMYPARTILCWAYRRTKCFIC